MDIKLKKSNFYSKNIKFMAIGMCLLLTIAMMISVFGIIWSTYRLSNIYGSKPYEKDYGYTSTNSFINKFSTLMDEAVGVNLLYKSEGYIREGNAVDEEELLRSFKNYYNIADGIITASTEIGEDYTVRITSSSGIPDELLYNFYEYSDLVSTKLRSYRNVYIQSQLDSYINMKKDLDSFVNFFYYIENNEGSRVAGNYDKEDIMKLEQYVILNGEFLSDQMNFYTGYSNSTIAEGKYILYAGIPNEFVEGDMFYTGQVEYISRKTSFPFFVSGFFICLFALLSIIVYVIRVAGQDEKGGDIALKAIDGVYNDVHAWIVFISLAILSMFGMFMFGVLIYTEEELWYLVICVVLTFLAVIEMSIFLSYICSVSRQVKAKRFFYNTLIAAVFRKAMEIIGGKSVTGLIVTIFMIYTIVCLALFDLARRGGIFLIILMAFVALSAIAVVRNMESLTTIMKAAKAASGGEYKNIKINKISTIFSSFAVDINNIQNGLQSSIQEAVKGERMKADLITNVSHDLKTPLTSIITYVDLLKRQPLNNTIADGYVDILVDKSLRLKQLIEDLIEASKASSGNLPVDKIKINLKELVFQACGEFEKRATAIGLEFRIAAAETVFIEADGNHMWRIYENLLSNVVKYAMPNSRVYINITTNEKYGVMVMRNVSQDEIKVNVENLAERFSRGDSSRTTEGSGLGLSIAKSLTILQGGKLGLAVDGDMFKVTVEMPLWKEKHDEKRPKIRGIEQEKKFRLKIENTKSNNGGEDSVRENDKVSLKKENFEKTENNNDSNL